MRGGNPTVADGLNSAGARLFEIAGWALVSASVGLFLRAIEERSRLVGRIVAGLLGMAWGITSYLVIPILLYLHLGTLLAAVLFFRSDLREMASELRRMPPGLRLPAGSRLGFLATALLCTGLVGIPLLLLEKRLFPALDGSLLFLVMGAGLLLTGFLLLSP
jgi:hypothetical protein